MKVVNRELGSKSRVGGEGFEPGVVINIKKKEPPHQMGKSGRVSFLPLSVAVVGFRSRCDAPH